MELEEIRVAEALVASGELNSTQFIDIWQL